MAIGTTAAILGSSAISGIAGASASSKAAKAQQAAADQASATQLQMFNQSRDDQEPWRQAGQAGLNELSIRMGVVPQTSARVGQPGQGLPAIEAYDALRNRLMPQYQSMQQPSHWDANDGGMRTDDAALEQAISAELARQQASYSDAASKQIADQRTAQAATSENPNFGSLLKNFTLADFEKDPGYEFRQAEGMKGITNSAAARGGLLSGAALKAAGRYNQEFASNEFGNAFNRDASNKTNQFNRLASLSGVGQTAANQIGQQGIATGNQIASNQIGAGNARASGYIGQSNALTGALGQGINAWQQQQYMNPVSYGGGMATNNTGNPAWMQTGGGYGGQGGGT